MSQKVLIVDDESTLRTALFRVFERKGFQVVTAATCAEAVKLTAMDQPVDLALIDLKLPDGDGIELMTALKKQFPEMVAIVFSGFATIESAVQATQKGAFHFITKPFNMDELLGLADRALSHKTLQQENSFLKTQLHQKYRFENIIGKSPEITQVLELIEKVSSTDSTVLITGESGTGKELVARAIHYNSSRAEKMMVPVNCGAIPGELLESEIFGHVKGAFTGAIANRLGRFEAAHNGTIFLDEIGELSPTLQVKLLRVIQERRFEAVGSAKTIEVDVRIIAATNVDLERAAADGRFREDLYYRLNVIPIHIPALRERKSDIPYLIHHFMNHFNQSKGRNLAGFSPEAMDLLMNYSWPGNVRELENLLERLSILKATGIVEARDLPERYRQSNSQNMNDVAAKALPNDGIDFNTAVDNYENALILQALEKTGWNRNRAAQLLRLNRTTLVEKIKKKGLAPAGMGE
ncbi:MAG: sigma-54-dependent transcriptional regulator [Bdellovibrionales bacterium]